MNSDELHRTSVLGLLKLYGDVLAELRRRGVVRSANNPVADYAEYLVAKALQLTPAAKSTKGYDATDGLGKKYEVKARRLTRANTSRRLSPFRDLESRHFEFLIGVLFNEDSTLKRACLVPFETVLAQANPNKHVNGHILHLRDSVWNLTGVVDITAEIQQAMEADAALKASV